METILSVVIPTHKRAKILGKCLEHLETQTVADQLEVIVVSDGPDEETQKAVSSQRLAVSVKYCEIPKSQQGIARNKGVQEAKGKYVLFIGDDIFLAPHACEVHLAARHSPSAASATVLGFTTWDPAVGITPVMRWLEKTGWQFGYPAIRPYAHSTIPSSIQHKFTYTSHISLPTEIAQRFPFREDIRSYGWEDIEWGWRLKEAGVQLFYEPNARALHHHHLTLSESLKRMEMLGRSAVHMEEIAPQLQLVPWGWKRLKYIIASFLPSLSGKHAHAFLSGLRAGHVT